MILIQYAPISLKRLVKAMKGQQPLFLIPSTPLTLENCLINGGATFDVSFEAGLVSRASRATAIHHLKNGAMKMPLATIVMVEYGINHGGQIQGQQFIRMAFAA